MFTWWLLFSLSHSCNKSGTNGLCLWRQKIFWMQYYKTSSHLLANSVVNCCSQDNLSAPEANERVTCQPSLWGALLHHRWMEARLGMFGSSALVLIFVCFNEDYAKVHAIPIYSSLNCRRRLLVQFITLKVHILEYHLRRSLPLVGVKGREWSMISVILAFYALQSRCVSYKSETYIFLENMKRNSDDC